MLTFNFGLETYCIFSMCLHFYFPLDYILLHDFIFSWYVLLVLISCKRWHDQFSLFFLVVCTFKFKVFRFLFEEEKPSKARKLEVLISESEKISKIRNIFILLQVSLEPILLNLVLCNGRHLGSKIFFYFETEHFLLQEQEHVLLQCYM